MSDLQHPLKVIYKIVYPNEKIYVCSDITGSANYFGSASDKLIADDFPFEARQSFTIRREILWWSDVASDNEVQEVKRQMILDLRANDPDRGYDQLPRFQSSLSDR